MTVGIGATPGNFPVVSISVAAFNALAWIFRALNVMTPKRIDDRSFSRKSFAVFAMMHGCTQFILLAGQFIQQDDFMYMLFFLGNIMENYLLLGYTEKWFGEKHAIFLASTCLFFCGFLACGAAIALMIFAMAQAVFYITMVLQFSMMLVNGLWFTRTTKPGSKARKQGITIITGVVGLMLAAMLSAWFDISSQASTIVAQLLSIASLVLVNVDGNTRTIYLRHKSPTAHRAIPILQRIFETRMVPRESHIGHVSFFLGVFLIGLVIPNFASFFRATADIQLEPGGRFTESLDRGMVAFYNGNGQVYLSWRLLESDPSNVSFNVYRNTPPNSTVKIASLVSKTTDYIDAAPSNVTGTTYWVCPVIGGKELAASNSTMVLNEPGKDYCTVKLGINETVAKLGIGDLNGDGKYDFVVETPAVEIDPLGPPLSTWHPSQTTFKIEAYLSNGTLLWRKDLGWDIETGTNYAPFVVYDFDMDGRAEIAVKTGDGDHRDSSGRVQSGPEYVSIWDGMTGREIARAPWPRRLPQIYNWDSRNSMGVAYLDGRHPYLVLERGTYWYLQLDTYRFDGDALKLAWSWSNMDEPNFYGINEYTGQGAHAIRVADVDGDGCDEIILGACVVDHDGKGLWTTGLQHVDHVYVGDIDPSHPGLEIYYGVEGIVPFPKKNGVCMVDAATGKILWGLNETTTHVHEQGLVSDIDASHPGMECYSAENTSNRRWLHAANGALIADEKTFDLGFSPKAVYWDADAQRELLVNERIFDYGTNYTWQSDIEGTQLAWADIFGDWREEIVTCVPGELRIYSTMIPAIDRRPCLMQDPIYRSDVALLTVGYPTVPMTSYCLANQ